jgi:NAD(P)-dependent dehydrogenase (short-subunit alcohol dehydrogenase family)
VSEQITHQPVAVVTGASSGFGKQITMDLAAEGWLTIGLARHEEPLEAVATAAEGEYKVCDVDSWGEVSETAEEVLEEHPRIDLVVNNAGMALRERFIDLVDSVEVEDVMTTNYMGAVHVAHAFLRGLFKAAPDADIVNVVSAAATVTNPNSAAYSASKAAQLAFSRSLATDLRPHGVRVHSILPGKANTEGHPQTKSSSPLSGIFGTDIEAVSRAVIDRIGESPREIYVPKALKAVAVLDTIAPVTVTRIVDKLIS